MAAAEPSARIAVVGMALRLPGAETPDGFWQNVKQATCSLTRVDRETLVRRGVPVELLDDPDYVPVHGAVAGAAEFDSAMFGFSAREAELTDPQQRKFLECAHEALDAAGVGNGAHSGRVGVVAGVGNNSYTVMNLLPTLSPGEHEATAILVAGEKDHVATRTAHRLALQGPALTVQTSCSTSLAAVHVACRLLLDDEADVCLAGGVSLTVPLGAGYVGSAGGIASPTGEVRAFDDTADGTVYSSGVGVVVLKRLDRAVADGHRIHAVISGSAMNNDGARKVGYTAPSVAGQVEVIRAAQQRAGVEPSEVQYVETHGTGTAVGDAIEVDALVEVFGGRAPDNPLHIGTLKPNIGHTDSASGIAGLIKAVLAVERSVLPPNLYPRNPSTALPLDAARLTVSAEARNWGPTGVVRRAGVSSFGLGGTNVHVVVEEAPRRAGMPAPAAARHVLPLSAASPEQLGALRAAMADHLASGATGVADAAHTLQVGRRLHTHRTVAVGRDAHDVARSMRSAPARAVARRVRLGWVFSGLGPHPGREAAELAAAFPSFRDRWNRAVEAAAVAFDAPPERLRVASPDADPADRLRWDQASQLVFQVAVAGLLDECGLSPTVVTGHSLGEYAAAHVAGAIDLDTAITLVRARCDALAASGVGAVSAVLASADEIEGSLLPGVEVGAFNAERSVTISGSPEAITEVEARLVERDIRVRRLPIHVAVHSPLLDPVLPAFAEVARRCLWSSLRIPFVSSVDGRRRVAGERLDADYWVRHLRQPVRFVDAAREVARPGAVLLEVGVGHTLTHLLQQTAGSTATCLPTVDTAPTPELASDATESMLQSVGEAWAAGADVEWSALRPAGEIPRLVPLPAHPFAPTRHWIAAPRESEPAEGGDAPLEADRRPGRAAEREVAQSRPPAVTVAQVAALWAELLGTVPDPSENFFELGGDSLALLSLVKRFRDVFGVPVGLREAAGAADLDAMVDLVARACAEAQGPA